MHRTGGARRSRDNGAPLAGGTGIINARSAGGSCRRPPVRGCDPMSESEDFATLFARHEGSRSVEVGQVVRGRVIQITAEHVFVDVGGKGEAWIDRGELSDDEGRLRVGVGDEVEATVVKTGDEVRLSHRLRQGAQAREALAVGGETRRAGGGKGGPGIKGGYQGTGGGPRAFFSLS